MTEDRTPQNRTDARRAADPDAPTPGAPAHAVDADPKTAPDPDRTVDKDPEEQGSGGEPMTGAQASHLKTLAEESGTEAYKPDLTTAEAALLIDELKDARQAKR